MNDELPHRLSGWLLGTDIALLELRGPGLHLRLHNDGRRVIRVPAGEIVESALEALEGVTATTLAVKASSVGIFLHAHPLHEAPLASPGQAVAAGQIIGLLRIGALLLPVTAPHGGTCLEHAAAHGSAVGYGTPLIHLAPAPAADRPTRAR
mgnify:CR=1 FL=1